MRTALILIAGTLAVAMMLVGCARTQAIKDLETDKVIVVETGDLSSIPEDIWALAQQGCSIHGRIPKPVSTHIPPATYGSGFVTGLTSTGQIVSGVATTTTTYNREHLFACIDAEDSD